MIGVWSTVHHYDN